MTAMLVSWLLFMKRMNFLMQTGKNKANDSDKNGDMVQLFNSTNVPRVVRANTKRRKDIFI